MSLEFLAFDILEYNHYGVFGTIIGVLGFGTSKE